MASQADITRTTRSASRWLASFRREGGFITFNPETLKVAPGVPMDCGERLTAMYLHRPSLSVREEIKRQVVEEMH